MTTDIDAILEAELARLAGSSTTGLWFETSARWGAQWAARHVGHDIHDRGFDLELEQVDAFGLFATSMQNVGRILGLDGIVETPDGVHATGAIYVRGLIGAGIRNQNPAVVDIRIVATSPRTCRVDIRGTAKEGLYKQHAGRKAVERLLDLAAALMDAAERRDAAEAHA